MADDRTDNTLRGRDLVGLGGLLVGAVVVGLVVGLLIDNAAGTSPVFTLVGILLGIVGGGVAFWARVRAALRP
ncbi:MAG TPA: AtpZ/AtpI family protein [Marmoricola sp.]|jgi:F0F1-type ATP synthase assembly protein I|nr:AtpZ/AtpI family protein [Marmoricola sp.]